MRRRELLSLEDSLHAPLKGDRTLTGGPVPLESHLPGARHPELGSRPIAAGLAARVHLEPARHHHAWHGHVAAGANGPDIQQLAAAGTPELDGESISTLPERRIRR